MKLKQADRIRRTLQKEFAPSELVEMFQAFRLLDKSLTVTAGEGWLDRVGGYNLPYDIRSVLSGNLKPDDRGVLNTEKGLEQRRRAWAYANAYPGERSAEEREVIFKMHLHDIRRGAA